MDEYIKKQDVLQKIESDAMWNRSFSALYEDIEEMTPEDVASVRHGCWVVEERAEHPTPYVTHKYKAYYCSECGRRLIGYTNPKDAPYCHCGAKMDGGN